MAQNIFYQNLNKSFMKVIEHDFFCILFKLNSNFNLFIFSMKLHNYFVWLKLPRKTLVGERELRCSKMSPSIIIPFLMVNTLKDNILIRFTIQQGKHFSREINKIIFNALVALRRAVKFHACNGFMLFVLFINNSIDIF